MSQDKGQFKWTPAPCQEKIQAVWARHAGNPSMAPCLLKVPEYETFCGQDWQVSHRHPNVRRYYQPIAVPPPAQSKDRAPGPCSRCVSKAWDCALAGSLEVISDLPPAGGGLDVAPPQARIKQTGPTNRKDSDRLTELCQHLGATTYLAGSGSRTYLDPGPFHYIGCAIKVQKLEVPPLGLSVLQMVMEGDTLESWAAKVAATATWESF